MATRILQNSFLGGEISPAMFGRVDSPLYQQGAAKVENFIIQAQGSLKTRSGFQYVATAKNSALPVRLIPFRFASDQTLVLVFGDRTMRIVTQGKVLLNNNNQPYEIATQYSANDLFELNYSQNADIITITSSKYPPTELRRYGATDWRFQAVTTAPTIQPPSSVSLSAYYPAETEDKDKGKITVTYVVTSVDSEDRESVASAEVTGTCNYYLDGGYMAISWAGVSGAVRYRVYRSVSGVFGFLGQTEKTSIRDMNDQPDTTVTPPRYAEPFQGGGKGAIISVDVTNGGSGYYYASQNGNVTLPQGISIPVVEHAASMYLSSGSHAAPDPKYELIIFNGTTGSEIGRVTVPSTTIYRLDWSSNADYLISIVGACGDADNRQNIYVSLGDMAGDTVVNPKVRLSYYFADFDPGLGFGDVNIIPSGWEDWRNAVIGSELYQYTSSFRSKPNFSSLHSQSGTGITLAQLYELYPQNQGVAEIPLTVTDPTGSGAQLVGLAYGGVITSVRIDSGGSNYTNPSISVSSTVGSGATFSAEIAGESDWEFPSAVTQFDQRRIFAGSNASPLKVWMTNAGQQSLMMYHLPVLSDDRIELAAVTSDADKIKHAVSLDSLILFTGSSELRVYTQNSDALAPDSVAVRAQSYVGANDCQPVIANNSVIYAASRGGHIRALRYTYSSGGYETADMSLLAPHLFDGYGIRDITLSKAPEQIVWAVSTSGELLGLTFYADQNINAWHHHVTDGAFESCCAVSEGDEDHLYVVVRRYVNGNSVRYIERMSNLRYTNDVNSRQLDSYIDTVVNNNTQALTASGMTLTGLSHLEGKTVVAVVDGKPQPETVVTNGQITIGVTGQNIAVGLPYKSTLITMPLTAGSSGNLQGVVKNVTEMALRIAYTGDIYTGKYPNGELWKVKRDDLEFSRQNTESKIVRITVDGDWDYNGQVKIEHDNALPLEIQAIIGNVQIEGVRR